MGNHSSAEDFFKAGGALDPNAPSYVIRTADAELWQAVLTGEYCNVLAARQLGKSSLKARTRRRLRDEGIRTVAIDLSMGRPEAGEVGTNQWYYGLICQFKRQLNLSVDEIAWWSNRHQLSPAQRFSDFLRQVVLEEVREPITVFIDEIDFSLRLPFSDGFFAAIRAAYNARADDPTYKRLNFVLLGAASPADLIKDRTRTPYNIGMSVDLRDFTAEEAQVLLKGLEDAYPEQAAAILDHILYWTKGHPYLTQKLCLEVVKTKEEVWTATRVDGLVDALLLSEAARNERNLQFVQDQILKHPHRNELLRLYKRVRSGKSVPDDGQSPIHNQLKLSGLVKAENGRLHVRNEIYRRVFNLGWVRQHTAINWWRVAAGIAAFVAALAVAAMFYNFFWMPIQFQDCENDFLKAHTPEQRLDHLARAFQQRGFLMPTDYDYRAMDLFYGLSRQEQLALFDVYNVEDTDLTTVVNGLYMTLADVDGTGNTTPLLEAMAGALGRLDRAEEASRLRAEIISWLRGRELARQNQYNDALVEYDSAIQLNGENPATLYERARVLTELSEYEQALSDLDQIVAIAARAVVPTPSSSLTTATDTPLMPTLITTPAIPGAATTLTGSLPTTVTPSPAVMSGSITSQFANRGQMISAVRNLMYSDADLVLTLAPTQNSEYRNLREFGLVPTPPTSEVLSYYRVQVLAADTGEGVQNAIVTMKVVGQPGVSSETDVHGVATFAIPVSYANRLGELMIQAAGYWSNVQDIDFTMTMGHPVSLFDLVLLEPVSAPTREPTPTPMPLLPTVVTPTRIRPLSSTPTRTAIPTPTRIQPPPPPTDIPTPTRAVPPGPATDTPYPPPVLDFGGIIACNVTFRWQWPGTLAENEWFAVRVGRLPDAPHSQTWIKELQYTYALSESGDYVWEVAICRADPATFVCDQLAVSERETFSVGECPVPPPTRAE